MRYLTIYQQNAFWHNLLMQKLLLEASFRLNMYFLKHAGLMKLGYFLKAVFTVFAEEKFSTCFRRRMLQTY